jgi:hypothetical protein
MMLANIESWEQKNIMLNKSNLKERKKHKRSEVAIKDRVRGKRVKIGYRKIQINGEWFIWEEREEKLKKHF